jgi:hypothetical protein
MGIVPNGAEAIIGLKTMARAIYLVDFYLQQLRLLYGRFSKTELPNELLRIVEFSQQVGTISARDICRKGWAKNTDEAYTLFEQLVSLEVGQLSQSKRGSWQWRYTGTLGNTDPISTVLNLDSIRDTDDCNESLTIADFEMSVNVENSTLDTQTPDMTGLETVDRNSTFPTFPTFRNEPTHVTVDRLSETVNKKGKAVGLPPPHAL